MGHYEAKKLLYSKRNGHQVVESAQRMKENHLLATYLTRD
jgi:hypothetical protein